jgi:hypothetical protein
VLFVIAISLRNIHAREGFLLRYSSNTPTFVEERSLYLVSSNGGFDITFVDGHDTSEKNVRSQNGMTRCSWFRDERKGYPEVNDPVFSLWGFKMKWLSQPDRPGGVSTRHFWLFICPAWFPLPFLSILPFLYIRRLLHRRKLDRWARTGCCQTCGYDLRAHAPGAKCSECGTPANPTATPENAPPSVPRGDIRENRISYQSLTALRGHQQT